MRLVESVIEFLSPCFPTSPQARSLQNVDAYVRKFVLAAYATAVGALCGAAAPVPTGSLTVRIGNVRNSQGQLRMEICPRTSFLKTNCPYSASAPAQPGVTTIMVRGVPPGEYAVQAFHDENSNGKLDRGLFGIPKEGVGFSNDAPVRFGPPKWADASFAFDGIDQVIRVRLRYFL